MLFAKLKATLGLVSVIIVLAVLGDAFASLVVLRHPATFAPLVTALLALIIGAPACYLLVSLRFAAQRAERALADSLAEKNRAIVEMQQRRQEAEEAQARAEFALERMGENETLYRLLADNQTDVITLWTAEMGRKYTSPSARRALGYAPAELQERPRLFNVHPDDIGVLRNLVEPLTPGGDAQSAEFRLIHKDGSEIWVEGAFRRLDDGSNGLLSTTRVINKRKALEQDLVRALEEAKAAVRAKSDFLANMTHELRTPLNAIIGFSGVLKQSGELSPSCARQVDLIADASRTLLGVVNDVLDFSKLEAGAVEPELQPLDPRALAETTAAMLAGQAQAKGVALSVSASGPEGLLLGDGPRLRQVLLNFLSNAIKFTARGAVEVRLSRAPDGEGQRLRVEVSDNGIGMSAEQIATIFDRFTQGDASVSRQYGGTGLGLAISKLIIEALGGTIGVDSRLGEGSTFWFEMTLALAGSADGVADTAAAPTIIDPALRLLVVDDNAVNRELICTLLAPFDLDVETAEDGVEAVEAAARTPFDLILMDVQMPNMDGLTATRRIRETMPPGAVRTPIIAMTANVLPDQVARCLEAGMDGHLGKPISPARLLEILAAVGAPEQPALDSSRAH